MGVTLVIVTSINEELVGPFFAMQLTGVAQVNIKQPITIYISHRNPCLPGPGPSANASRKRDILKMHGPFIKVKLVITHVGGEIYIRQSIPVHITGGYTAAVIEILIHQHIGV